MAKKTAPVDTQKTARAAHENQVARAAEQKARNEAIAPPPVDEDQDPDELDGVPTPAPADAPKVSDKWPKAKYRVRKNLTKWPNGYEATRVYNKAEEKRLGPGWTDEPPPQPERPNDDEDDE